jgi:hypothetical protein
MSHQISAKKYQQLIDLIQQHAAGKQFTVSDLLEIRAIQQAGFKKTSMQQIIKIAYEQGDIKLIEKRRVKPRAAPAHHYFMDHKTQPSPKPPLASAKKTEFIWDNELNSALYKGITIPASTTIRQIRAK